MNPELLALLRELEELKRTRNKVSQSLDWWDKRKYDKEADSREDYLNKEISKHKTTPIIRAVFKNNEGKLTLAEYFMGKTSFSFCEFVDLGDPH